MSTVVIPYFTEFSIYRVFGLMLPNISKVIGPKEYVFPIIMILNICGVQ